MEEILSKSTKGLRKAGIATLAVTLTLGAGVIGAGSASATTTFDLQRVNGVDRYETAAVAADAYATSSTEAILANGEPGSFADALSANYLAGAKKAPILLTRKDTTPDFTLNELKDLGVTNITVVGGPGVVSDEQVAALRGKGYTVTRVSGGNRFDTNADVIKNAGTSDALGVIATGMDFPDALGGGPVAYNGHALGLSESDDIDDDVVAALKAAGVKRVIVLGGPTIVGDKVVAELAAAGITLDKRVYGDDRSETSTALADYAVANLGFVKNAVNVASGYTKGGGADALAGGPLTGKEKRALLVTRDVNNPGDVTNWLKANANTLTEGRIFGGPAAVSAAAEDTMEKAGQSVTSNQTYTVTPADAVSQTLQSDESAANADRNADNRSYSVSGLADGTTYVIQLVDADNVKIDANGQVTFLSKADATSSTGYSADPGTPATHLASVNNQTATGSTATTQPVNGNITFAIDGDSEGSVVPVIFVQGGPDGTATTGGTSTQLEVNTTQAGVFGTPAENFGIGGKTTYVPAEAGNGPITGTPAVTSVNKDANSFVAGGATYNYDSNDSYTVDSGTGAVSVGQAAFEAALSTGDNVGGSYTQDPAGVSVFNLTDDSPGKPAGVTATAGTTGQKTDDITVTVDAGGQDYDSIVIQRAKVVGGTPGEFTTIANTGTDADTTAANFQYVDQNVPAGTYRYRAALVKDGDQGAYKENAADAVSKTPSSDTTAPTINDLVVTDTVANGELDNTDVVTFTFSEDVADNSGATRTFTITDSQGETFKVSGTTTAPSDSTTGLTDNGRTGLPSRSRPSSRPAASVMARQTCLPRLTRLTARSRTLLATR